MKPYYKHIAQTLLLNIIFDWVRHISVPLAENLIKNQFKMLFLQHPLKYSGVHWQ